MHFSDIAKTIGESATLKLNQTAAALRQKGEPVIHLGGGEPVSRAPEEAIRAATKLLETGEVRYTPAAGTPALRKAIVRYTERFYRHGVEPKNVMVSGGAKQAIMVCLQAILNPGDELLFPTPYWVSYPDMARLCGAVPVPVLPADGSFHPKLSDLERKVTVKTRAIILNSPNNPTGAFYAKEFVADVVAFCEAKRIFLIMDDIYHRLVFDGREPVSCYDFAKEKGEESRLVVINGVSKAYAMTGFRIGWAVASPKLIEVMTNIQGHQTSGPSALGQEAALGALEGSQESVEALRASLERNRDALMEELAKIPGVKAARPEGTFYCFADFRSYGNDSTKLAQFLLEKALVVTVPGVEFGLEGHLRISTCGSASEIAEGLERMRVALRDSPPGPRS